MGSSRQVQVPVYHSWSATVEVDKRVADVCGHVDDLGDGQPNAWHFIQNLKQAERHQFCHHKRAGALSACTAEGHYVWMPQPLQSQHSVDHQKKASRHALLQDGRTALLMISPRISLLSESEAPLLTHFLTATGVPSHVPRYTTEKPPDPSCSSVATSFSSIVTQGLQTSFHVAAFEAHLLLLVEQNTLTH